MQTRSQGAGGAGVSLEHALADLVSRQTVRVPPYPATAMKLAAVLRREDYTTADLVEAMRADPVFTANLLRLANSSFYRRGAEVTSLAVAVQRLGGRELTRLAMASSVARLASAEGPLHPMRRRAWREALSSAMVCEVLCRQEGRDADEGFVAALLHDAGKLLALGAIEDLLRASPGLPLQEAAEWDALVEKFHVPFGELLAQRWSLPGVLGAVITTHHEPALSLGPLTRAVVLADRVVGLLEQQVEVTAADLEHLGLRRGLAEVVAAAVPGIPGTLRAFDATPPRLVPLPPMTVAPGGPMRLEVEGEAPWPVVRLDERTLEVLAPRVQAPHVLLEVTLQPEGLRFWALVERCVARAGPFAVTLAPFALPCEEARRWQALRS